ncbi:hypothetical protein PG988_010602 [Apiospora saccharicola]
MCFAKTNGTATDAAVGELIRFTKANSPYYAHAWRDLDDDHMSLSNIPVVDHASFWESNTCRHSTVLTSQQTDGIIFKTGGTTAHPKVSFYSHDELTRVSKQLAECLTRCGVQSGDLVANLFYAGDLYGSFLLHILSVYQLRPGAIQLPVAGHVGLESMEQHLVEFEATVVLATVTTMTKLAERILGAGKTHPYVRLLLFSGEAFYDDQAGLLTAAFPHATVKSLIYGSMDCGVIGLPPPPPSLLNGIGPGIDVENDPRLHQVNSPAVVVEILGDDDDDQGQGGPQSITTPGQAGRLVVTNVERRLMPIVRYPSGDRACWVDKPRGLFRILDRDRTAIRLGPVSIDFVDLRRVVAAALAKQSPSCGGDDRDGRPASRGVEGGPQGQADPGRRLYPHQRGAGGPMFREHVDRGLVAELGVRFVHMEELAANPRSGKAVEVLDVRSTTV